MRLEPEQLGNLSATALLGWYAWHTAARTIPRLVRAFQEEMSSMREEYRHERGLLREEMASQRLQEHRDHLELIRALHEVEEGLQSICRSRSEVREQNLPCPNRPRKDFPRDISKREYDEP